MQLYIGSISGRNFTNEISWENFKEALVARFVKGRLDKLYGELKELRQRGTVDEYIREFELHSSQCGKLPESQYLGYFIGGLWPEIKQRGRTLRPKSHYQAMQVARDVEGELWPREEDEDRGFNKSNVNGLIYRQSKAQSETKYSVDLGYSSMGQNAYPVQTGFTRVGSQGGVSGTEGGSRSTTRTTPSAAATSNTLGSQTSSSSTQSSARKRDFERRLAFKKSRGVRHLTYSEMLDRKACGQCFRYGEKFHPLHKCRQLRVIIVGDDE